MTETVTQAPVPPKSRLDILFSAPAAAVLLAVLCNILWGSAFPFIKMGYRLFAMDAADTPSILCFAGVRFMMGSALVYLCGLLLHRRPLTFPRGRVLASCCGLGLWQTTAQYFFYYAAVAALTGALGGILNSTQSFMGVILAHFLYGRADRLTPRKALGCALGFGGVLVATIGNHGGGSGWGIGCMLAASAIFAVAGPWNKAVTKQADSFSVCCINLGVGGLALLVMGLAMGGQLHPQSPLAIPVLLYLAFVSGAGYVLWALLMKNNPVSRISVFGLLIPVINVLLSALLNGEPLFEWQYIGALVLVCGGIWLVNRPKKEPAAP
ncbi:MAG: DMT family transporter [Gemmiger sp.]|nr:DMT family transporter [Gemmiger sp.]